MRRRAKRCICVPDVPVSAPDDAESGLLIKILETFARNVTVISEEQTWALQVFGGQILHRVDVYNFSMNASECFYNCFTDGTRRKERLRGSIPKGFKGETVFRMNARKAVMCLAQGQQRL